MPKLGQTGAADGLDPQQVLRQVSQYQNRFFISTQATQAALTDNSGGTANGTAAGRTVPTVRVPVSVNAAVGTTILKAGFDTNLALAKDALREVQTKAHALMDLLGFATADKVTYSGGGTAPDGTIAAIAVNVGASAVSPDSLAFAGLNAILDEYRNAADAIRVDVNKLRVACGLAPVNPAGDGTRPANSTVAVITGTTGAAVATGTASVATADGNNVLSDLRDVVATLAAAVNDAKVANPVPYVLPV